MPQKAPSDLPLDAALFRRKSAWEFFPAVDYGTSSPRARRNPQTSGTGNSMLLVKALLTVLVGKIDRALTDHSAFFYVSAQSLSGGKDSYVAMKTDPLAIQSFFGSTYHVGTLFLVEAIERGPVASDVIGAWVDLVEFTQTAIAQSLGHPLRWADLERLSSSAFNDALLRVADELYYWTRYEDAPASECVANGPHDRLDGSVIERLYPKPSAGADDLTPLLLDPAKLRERANVPTTEQPSSAAPASAFAGFYGPQLKMLMDAITRTVPTLLYGPTGTGKSTCEAEAMKQLADGGSAKRKRKAAPQGGTPLMLAHERVDGKEGLEDIDLLGAIVPQGEERVWVDGPLTRAFRRAQAEKVVLFVDEITTIPTAHVNILKGVLNPTPGTLLERQEGVVFLGESPSDRYYYLEIPQTTERLAAPVEQLAIVAACNLGSQYAVHPLDPALERRFQFHIEFAYLPIQDEANLIVERTRLAPKLALACARVAAKTREKAENAEVADGLDPASLLVWAGEIARANPKNAATAQTVFVETARYTWLPRVVGRDHRGLVPRAKAQGIEDAIADQAQNAFTK
jgi:MoxR-like ATPase